MRNVCLYITHSDLTGQIEPKQGNIFIFTERAQCPPACTSQTNFRSMFTKKRLTALYLLQNKCAFTMV